MRVWRKITVLRDFGRSRILEDGIVLLVKEGKEKEKSAEAQKDSWLNSCVLADFF